LAYTIPHLRIHGAIDTSDAHGGAHMLTRQFLPPPRFRQPECAI
jgi:hypothetical protein